MDIYKYQIWTCNIPGVYTPGCNDAFTMSSTTPSTPAQLQMANLGPRITSLNGTTSSQYQQRIYGNPTSSAMPAANPCLGAIECGGNPNCFPALYIDASGMGGGMLWNDGVEGAWVTTNASPVLLDTFPSLPDWQTLYDSGDQISVVLNFYGPGAYYVYCCPYPTNPYEESNGIIIPEDIEGPYEWFVCAQIEATCSVNEPSPQDNLTIVADSTDPQSICVSNDGENSGILYTTYKLRTCFNLQYYGIEGSNEFIYINVGIDSNWSLGPPDYLPPQIGQSVAVNLENSTLFPVDGPLFPVNVIPEDICANVCFTIEDIEVSDTPPSSTINIIQYPIDCYDNLCGSNCPEVINYVQTVTLTRCGNPLDSIWGNTASWESTYEFVNISLDVNPDLVLPSQNGGTVLVNLNSMLNIPNDAPIFWACYTVSSPSSVDDSLQIGLTTIEFVDVDYTCNGPLCNTYPGAGCADATATNYDELAIDCYAGLGTNNTTSTDCCVYGTPIYGCTDPSATNYYPGNSVVACNGINGNPVGDYTSTGGLQCGWNSGTIHCCCAYTNTVPCPLALQYGFLGTVWMGTWVQAFEDLSIYDPPGPQWNDWAAVVEYPVASGAYWFSPIAQESPLTPGPPGIGSDWFQCEVNCIDLLASNYNVTTNVDCAGIIGGTDYSCCVYDAPCSNQLTIFLEQDFNDIGHYSLWDGEILQKDTFSNFTWSASTGSPWTVTVQNSTEFGFYEDTQGFEWTIDWGDGSFPQTVQYPTTQLTYIYSNSGTYTANIQMSAPWGITAVSQPITLPANNATDPNFDPNPNATFSFNPPGGWATLPMNWLYSDWGPLDSGVDPQDYVTTNYTPTPFCFTGITQSQLGAFQTYSTGTNNLDLPSGYYEGVAVPLGGQVEMPDGTIQNDLVGEIIGVTAGYTAYTISDGSQGAIGYPVTLYDFDNGITLFEACGDGLNQYNMYTINCGEEAIACAPCLGEQSFTIMSQTYYVNVTNNMGAWDINTTYDAGDFVYHNGCCWFANGEGGYFSGAPSEPGLIQGNRTKYWYVCPGQNEKDCDEAGNDPGSGPQPNSPCSECFNQTVTSPVTGNLIVSDSYFTGIFDSNYVYSVGNIVSSEICCWIVAKDNLGELLGTPGPNNPHWINCPSNPVACLGGSSNGRNPATGWLSTDNLINDSYCLNLNQEWVSQGYLTYNAQQIYNVGDVIYYEATSGPTAGTGNFFTPSPNPASVGFSGILGVPPEPQNVGCYGDGCNPTSLTSDYWRGCAFTV